MSAPHRIRIARERFKFSCAHMTVFPDGSKERLHGHNYYLAIEVELAEIGFESLVDFGPLKKTLAELCDDWRERLLLAANNPKFEIVRDDDELEFRLCGDRYVVPRGDALLLPIDNVSVEALSQLALARVLERGPALAAAPAVLAVTATVEESPGQGASSTWRNRSAG
jgi:6-pyruvoyltetrahydropterin/6-carboxytetrahydropterin synthase